MTKTMRAVEIRQPGGPEVLALGERAVPEPGPQEVLIRVTAAGVNRPDVLQRLGLYPPPPGASDIPGLEVAGVIVRLGAGVAAFHEGDEVCALLTGGGYAEFAVAHEGSCLPVPERVSLVEAAGLPETFFTVWANVFDDAKLQSGETLLVHGGAGGIGVTAITLAKAMGARVIATASSAEKLSSIRALGADAALDYRSGDWESEITSMGGADVVLDMAGGDFVKRNMAALNPGGRHVSIAFLRGNEATIDIFLMMRRRQRLSGSTMKTRSVEEKARIAATLRRTVWPLFAEGRLRPVTDMIFPLAAAADAHRRMEAGAHTGKMLLSTA